jgi:lon-related putative ATP-dependent protease
MEPGQALRAAELSRRCDAAQFTFETTAELEELDTIPGQERAIDAIHFASSMPVDGHNLYVQGRPGTGRHSFVLRYLRGRARDEQPGSDWVYVNRFDAPRRPRCLEVPAGRGEELRVDVEHLIEDGRTAIPAAFQSEDFQTRRAAIEEEFSEQQEKALQEVQDKAKERGIGIMQTPTGFAFAPLKDDKPIEPEDFKKLSDEEQERIQAETEEVGKELRQVMQALPRRMRTLRDRIRELEREVSMFAVGGLIDDLLQKYEQLPDVVEHLKRMQTDIVDNVELFLASEKKEGPPDADLGPLGKPTSPAIRRYGVNVVVHQEDEGAPVVFEDSPTMASLIGKIEHRTQFGALVTDFQLIEAGALHRANGGYLVLDARKVLARPHAWEALKRALKSEEVRIQSLGEVLSLVSTVTLEPEPIPLRVKVVLVGDHLLYYLLQAYDPEFSDLFKVTADFDDRMDRTPETELQLAQMIGALARREHLAPLDRGGVARVIEQCARDAGDSEKLSARIRLAADITREAHFHAKQADRDVIGAEDVQAAIDARVHRAGRVRDRLQEQILRGTVLIDTEGEKAGQVNGLAVMQLGELPFGRPSRITARVTLGAGKVIDIEREAETGGPSHSKGVLILSGYLRSLVVDRPLSLHASLVFEQSYGGIDGDSASAAELCALLSVLADAPIQQSLAITGSVNQHGDIQAIGGVNEKIEGFFDICASRGLTGEQGVLIPAANVKHLMLRQDVVDAAAAGRFHVYAMNTVDECLARLTGLPAEELSERVRARLVELSDQRKAYGAKDEKK